MGPLKALLETAADTATADRKGRTCLDLAMQRQQERGGRSPQRRGRGGGVFGVGSETDECVRLLVDYGAPRGEGPAAATAAGLAAAAATAAAAAAMSGEGGGGGGAGDGGGGEESLEKHTAVFEAFMTNALKANVRGVVVVVGWW